MTCRPRRKSAFDRILRGANPGELPVHEPSIDIVVNQKTARALGFVIPSELLARAKLIE
jgi:ABC-type uncharacterized transport system substrate-binding protein